MQDVLYPPCWGAVVKETACRMVGLEETQEVKDLSDRELLMRCFRASGAPTYEGYFNEVCNLSRQSCNIGCCESIDELVSLCRLENHYCYY